MNIVIMGPVGSGKSTQAQLIARELGISTLNTGDLLYFKSKEDSDIGQLISSAMRAGEIVDEGLTLDLIEKHLREKEHQRGFILDGFPRTIWQAENLKIPINKAIYLATSDAVNTKRLLNRGRSDDTLMVIEKRLKVYHRETQPILSFYRKKGILIEINGERDVDEILDDILEKIK